MAAEDNLNNHQFATTQKAALSRFNTEHPADVQAGIAQKLGEMHQKSAGPSTEETLAAASNIVAAGHARGRAASMGPTVSQEVEEEED